MKEYRFIIDTNEYVGGFYFQMCSYMTGVLGYEQYGSEEQKDFERISDVVFGCFDSFEVLLDHDEDGDLTPCYIDWGDDGMSFGIYVDGKPSEEDINFLKCRALGYASSNNIKIKGFRFLDVDTIVKERYVAI